MPHAPASACIVPYCPYPAARRGRCIGHAQAYDQQRARAYDQGRGTPTQRGYGAAWQQLRKRVLQEEPFCRLCDQSTTDVDHIIPKRLGGLDDRENLQGLCKRHHGAKSIREVMG